MADSDNPDNLISLAQYRTRLSRGRRLRRADELLSTPDPDAAVRAVPADELYYLMAERGLPEATELLVHASAEQVQTTLDFAIWDRDRISLKKSADWLTAITEAPMERIYEWARGLDVELMVLIIRQRARVYNLVLELPPDDPEGTFWNTPDGSFQIDLLGDAEQQRIVHRLISVLYSQDLEYARELLVGISSELDSELEESAYRWRTGRMNDLGFADPYEALDVYRELDPASVKIGEGRPAQRQPTPPRAAGDSALRLPGSLVETLANGEGLLARAVAGVTNAAELEDIHVDLVYLCNRVLSADRVNPGAIDRMGDALSRVSATLDLALEFLSQGDTERATDAVRTITFLRLHRLGATLIGKVGKLAATLQREHPFAGLPDLDLFEPEDREVLDALSRSRPAFPRVLDQQGQGGTRWFSSLADLKRAAVAVQRAAAALSLLGALGVTPEALDPKNRRALGIRDAMLVDAGVLARTALGLRLLRSPGPAFRALSQTECAALQKLCARTAASENHPTEPTVIEQALDLLRAAVPGRSLSPEAAAVARRWTESLLPLQTVLATD